MMITQLVFTRHSVRHLLPLLLRVQGHHAVLSPGDVIEGDHPHLRDVAEVVSDEGLGRLVDPLDPGHHVLCGLDTEHVTGSGSCHEHQLWVT